MNTKHGPSNDGSPDNAVVPTEPPETGPVLHQLRSVRRRQGISIRTVASRLGVDGDCLKAQEAETTDLPLSVLHQWAAALEVPVTELLIESAGELASPPLDKANLLRMVKTVQAILKHTRQSRIKYLGQMLVEQLVELMPELADIDPSIRTGSPHRRNNSGRAAAHTPPHPRRIKGPQAG